MKRLIGIILSLIVVISCTVPISVEAKIIEPEIVSSETWMCSYYVSAPEPISDLTGDYPYLACKCDIYSDGTIEFYCWNTHEWNSFVYDPDVIVCPLFEDIRKSTGMKDSCFTDVSKKLLISKDVLKYDSDGVTISDNRYDRTSQIENIITNYISPNDIDLTTFEPFIDGTVSFVKEVRDYEIKGSWLDVSVDLSYIDGYNVSKVKVNDIYRTFDIDDAESVEISKTPYYEDYRRYLHVDLDYVDSHGSLRTLNSDIDLFNYSLYTCPEYTGKLGNLPCGEDNYFIKYVLYPNKYPSESITVTIAGKTITVTPELLGNKYESVHTTSPETVYVKYLEGCVSSLEQELKSVTTYTETTDFTDNLFGDVNKDNLVDVADAQMILNYYVYTLANSNAEPLEEWISKQ